MSKPFLIFYQFFQKRTGVLVMLLGIYIMLAGWSISNLKFQEDITQMMPVGENFEEFNALFKNSNYADRLIFRIFSTDSIETFPDSLIQFSDSLVAKIQTEIDTSLIENITHKIDESQFLDLLDIVLNNFPIFLQEKDYDELENLTNPSVIESKIKGSFKALMSPGGTFLKKIVLKDPLGFNRLILSQLKEFQVDENFDLFKGNIVTSDMKNQVFFLTTQFPSSNTQTNDVLLQKLDEIILETTQQFRSKIQCEYFGAPAVAVANARQIRKDIHLTVGIALVALFLLITFFFRRFSSFFILLIPTFFGAITSLGILSFWNSEVSLISIAIGSVLLGITIDYSLHILTHFQKIKDIRRVLRDISTPILMSALTTSGAFFCLFFVQSQALHDLGLFAGLSVLSAALFALILLPHLIKSHNYSSVIHESRDNTYSGGMKTSRLKRVPLRAGFWSILLLTTFFILTNRPPQFENDLNTLTYFPQKLKEAEFNLNQISSAALRGVFLISEGQNLEEALQKSETNARKLTDLKNANIIQNFVPIQSIFPSRNLQEQRIKRWEIFWTKDKKIIVENEINKASDALKFKENAFELFFETITKKHQPVSTERLEIFQKTLLKDNISFNENGVQIFTLIRAEQAKKTKLYEAFKNEGNTILTDRENLTNQLVEILKVDFNRFLKISMSAVFLLLLVGYGRIELAIIAYLPIFLSWQWTLGLMQFFGIQFNIVNIIIATFVFGLGIDYSIFVMRGLLQEYKTGEKNLTSYKKAIFLSVATTLAGIGVLIFAQHPALKSIALLSFIGIGSVLILVMILQPILFRWLVYQNGAKREYPITVLSFFQTLANYFQLVLGCLIITILGGLIYALFFISIETRKLWIHYLIYWFSNVYIKLSFPFRETVLGSFKDTNHSNSLSYKPAIFIANHQSLIDTPIMLRFHPKTIILTKDWVYNNPLFFLGARLADFHNVSGGFEKVLPLLKKRVEEGYSIAIFPEGARSDSEKIGRFHKGAFYLSEALDLDVVPIWIHGTGRFLRKGSFWGKWNNLTIKIGERIQTNDTQWGTHYSKKTKSVLKSFRSEFEKLKAERETCDYFREKLLENYTYKGPVLEWYMKIKTRMEGNYLIFNELVPRDGVVTDIGCGYGFMSYMLSFTSKNRKILGLDYDEEKISVAQNCPAKHDRIKFEIADVVNHPLQKSDVFLLADVLHYLREDAQWNVLENCVQNLNPNGKIIIRDGDADLKKRHKGTRWTEVFSTKSGFNKTKNNLCYLSGSALEKWAKNHGFKVEKIDQTKHTSNIIFVLSK